MLHHLLEPITVHAAYVAVCSGLHVIPSIPSIEGIEHVLNPEGVSKQGKISLKQQVFHSSDYKTRSQLANRRVMILGTGETGHDLAYESVKAGAKEVILCTRGTPVTVLLAFLIKFTWYLGGFLSFPKVLVGKNAGKPVLG